MKKTSIDGFVGPSILGDLLQANALVVVEVVNQWVHEPEVSNELPPTHCHGMMAARGRHDLGQRGGIPLVALPFCLACL